jgi:hypothetical protein
MPNCSPTSGAQFVRCRRRAGTVRCAVFKGGANAGSGSLDCPLTPRPLNSPSTTTTMKGNNVFPVQAGIDPLSQ